MSVAFSSLLNMARRLNDAAFNKTKPTLDDVPRHIIEISNFFILFMPLHRISLMMFAKRINDVADPKKALDSSASCSSSIVLEFRPYESR